MSVIDEALKKTQSALHETHESNADDLGQTVSIDPALIHTPKKELLTFDFRAPWAISLVSVIFLFITVFCFHQFLENVFSHDFSFYHRLFHHTPVAKPAPIVKAVTTPPQPAIASIPLTLNGTMQVDNQRVALINHQLFHVGQMIEGLQIKQIHYSAVMLENPVTQEKRILTPALVH